MWWIKALKSRQTFPFEGGVKGLGSGAVSVMGDVVALFGAFSQKKGAAVVNRWIDRVVGSRIIVRGPHNLAQFAHKFARVEKTEKGSLLSTIKSRLLRVRILQSLILPKRWAGGNLS